APYAGGPSEARCYYSASRGTTAGPETYREQITSGASPSRAACKSLAAAHGYAYFGMTGTNGFTGFCFFGRAMPPTPSPPPRAQTRAPAQCSPTCAAGPRRRPTCSRFTRRHARSARVRAWCRLLRWRGKHTTNGSTCESGFYDSNNVCTPCSVANCATCPTASTCSACESGYGLASSTSCVACNDANCDVCSSGSAGACTTCKSGWALSAGVCVAACPPETYNNAGVCTACGANCGACSASGCSTCDGTFWNDAGVCRACGDNCDACSSSSTCTTCADGYELSGGACQLPPDPSEGNAAGDPHLMGFNGQSYSFCEDGDGKHCLGRTFSMLSAPAYALNTHINSMAGPDAWPHAGAWMTGLGFRFGNILSVTLEMATDVEYKVVPDGRGKDTTRAVVPEDWEGVFASMRVNGNDVLELIGTGETLLLGVAGEASVHFPVSRHKGDDIDGTVAVIMTPALRIKLFLESEDVTHLDFEITLFSSAITAANTHGLLGQSLAWAPGAPAAIEGHELDYVVQGGLLATRFRHNRFEDAVATPGAAAAAARRMLGRQPAVRRGGSRLLL
ncbi:MAG: hypothetical protein J3K34DRAFT_481068, partial [Monoraphidium minutum]